MGQRKRLAVARLWFEGNAFCPVPATMAQFEQYEWQSGPQVLETMDGTATELGAVARFAAAHPDWEVVVLRCASALPAGPIADDVITRLTQELHEGLNGGADPGSDRAPQSPPRWDAVYLSLHGAAITPTRETPELDIARMVRALLPDVPLGASFDLHGNMPPAWADVLDVAAVYRTHPHVDMDQAADRVLRGLLRCVDEGLKTHRVLVNEGVVLPSINMRTAAGPMHELEQAALAQITGAVLDVLVFGGFPYSDTAATGASIFAISDAAQDPQGAQAKAAARAVHDRVRACFPQFIMTLPSPQAALAEALAIEAPGLIAVTDSGDNPMSGGGGDTPGLFAALCAARPSVSALFASFADAGVVALARQAGVGGTVDVALGGRHGKQFGEPVPVRVIVERITDGRYRNTGPMQTGVERSCGNSAVLALRDLPRLSIIVTERVVAADDPAFYALHGIDLDTLRLLCVKAKNHFRAAFAQRCVRIIDCDAPGPACLDLSQLPFRNAHVSAGYPALVAGPVDQPLK
ncbi:MULTISPECIES: M81 family metallopeptidase [unclassified Achromobacter]|uniref:M81 family metallopeptidase n=1 Tax=unclassified Achromobacter TaxID=2626865 RepID=UPI000B518322|nr:MULTISPECIES: M81 family metallopeptidase [unclassified Achromobacter]OWT73789.1 MlrC family protein 10 [Achromobacter sp. HZ34]OWT79296.1 MlrC family protein 10 [Achromobacter sp. HZ28]